VNIVSSTSDPVQRQLERIIEDSIYSAKSHFEAASFWETVHVTISVLSILLSLVAGGTALQSYPMVAAVAAFAAALVASLTTFLNPIEKSYAHKRSADHFLQLRNKSRHLLEVGDINSNETARKAKLDELVNEQNTINGLSAAIPKFAFNAARKAIEAGEHRYEVDKK
jgi:hypothetical protein